MNTIPNLSKACKMLQALVEQAEGISLADAARDLKIPRTTAFRILNTFCAEGLVLKKDENYHAGPGLMRMGLLALNRMDLREEARPLLLRLARQTGETAHLAVFSEGKSLIMEVCESPFPLRAASRPGTLADLHASSTGKVFLSFLEETKRKAVLKSLKLNRRTPHTLISFSQLEKEAALIRQRGYAIDNEEYHQGVRCLAAPVWDGTGSLVAAIGITGAAERFVKSRIPEVAGSILKAAEALSLQMGFQKAA